MHFSTCVDPVKSFLSEGKWTVKLAITERCNANVSNSVFSLLAHWTEPSDLPSSHLCSQPNQCLLSTEAGFVNSAVSTLLCHLFQDKLSRRNGLFNYSDYTFTHTLSHTCLRPGKIMACLLWPAFSKLHSAHNIFILSLEASWRYLKSFWNAAALVGF